MEAVVRAENGFNLIVQAVEGLDGDALLDLSDRFKQRHTPAAVVLGGVEDGKVTLIANFDEGVAERDQRLRRRQGRRGARGRRWRGRRTMARAGGKDPEQAVRSARRSGTPDPGRPSDAEEGTMTRYLPFVVLVGVLAAIAAITARDRKRRRCGGRRLA